MSEIVDQYLDSIGEMASELDMLMPYVYPAYRGWGEFSEGKRFFGCIPIPVNIIGDKAIKLLGIEESYESGEEKGDITFENEKGEKQTLDVYFDTEEIMNMGTVLKIELFDMYLESLLEKMYVVMSYLYRELRR